MPRSKKNELQSQRTLFNTMSTWALSISKDEDIAASLGICDSAQPPFAETPFAVEEDPLIRSPLSLAISSPD